jgi:hypothetical protein
MCDLVTAAAVGSLAFGAMGAYQQSASAKASAEYQAQVAQNNAISAEYQAQDAIKRGEVAEAEQRRKTMMLKGSQTARLAANGLDISEGSALQILSDTDWMGEQDALTVRDNASREAWAYRQQGSNAQSNSNMLQASADAQNPLFAGATSLMTNPDTGVVADKWMKMAKGSGSSNSSSGIKISSDPWATF